MAFGYKTKRGAVRDLMKSSSAQDLIRSEGERVLGNVKRNAQLSESDVSKKTYIKDFGGGSGKSMEQLVSEGYDVRYRLGKTRPRSRVWVINPAAQADNARYDTVHRSIL